MRKVVVSLEGEDRGIWLSVEETFEDGNYTKTGKLISSDSYGAFDSLLDYGRVLYKNLPLENK
jgi:hypothetical protein